jgi:hypothetical protein
MIIDIVCTFSATTIQAETKSVSLVLTFPATQLPSNICEEVQDCLGISPSGEADYFLNEQGDWVQVQGGGGGNQTLNEVLVEGNTTDGEDILISDGDQIQFDNYSRIRKGLTDAGNGGAKGVALVCSLDYELKWEAGRLYTMQQDGFTIREVSHNFTFTPTANDDDTKGFVIGSRWILDNGDVYVCSDATTGAAVWALIIEGTVTSVGLTMPSAFTVANSPITSSGDIAVTGAGLVSQYVRGDGSLANFPASTGGGASLSFYLNGSVSQGTFGGVAFKEMNRTPILGLGTNFTLTNTNNYIASFLTDAGDPNQLNIPAGNWNCELYFNVSNNSGNPSFYIELYKYDGVTFTLIASSSTNPEFITNGTQVDLYTTAIPVPQTTLLATDRLAVRLHVNTAGNRTVTLHTEDNNLCQVITTFSTGLTALNGLIAQVQNFATGTSGTDFAINSATGTHTFNLPTASATNTGKLSSADWSTFDGKQNALGFTPENVANKATTFATVNDTLYPTVKAVNDQLTNRLFYQNTNRHTNNINTEVVAYAVLIPANTITAGKSLKLLVRNTRVSGATGVLAARIRIATTATPSPLTSAQVLMFPGGIAPTAFFNQAERTLAVQSASSTLVFPVTVQTNQDTKDGNIFFAQSNLNINWTVNQYILFTNQANVGGDVNAIDLCQIFIIG